MKRLLSMAMLLVTMISSMAVSANAAEYTFDGVDNTVYYPSTSYEDTHTSRYIYGGTNLIDYQIPELPYGVLSTTQTGIMEKRVYPNLQQGIGGISGNGIYGVTGSTGSYGVGVGSSVLAPGVSLGGITTLLPSPIAFTEYSKDFCLSNGAVGRISIPAIGVSRYYVWEGETSSSLSKGLAHFSSTSVWDGNVGICGHNRGAKYVIGDIKELEPGDKITYTTSEGTRTYEVETVTTIRNDDWSYLAATSDNRITLITCVKDDSSHRLCIQAVEVD